MWSKRIPRATSYMRAWSQTTRLLDEQMRLDSGVLRLCSDNRVRQQTHACTCFHTFWTLIPMELTLLIFVEGGRGSGYILVSTASFSSLSGHSWCALCCDVQNDIFLNHDLALIYHVVSLTHPTSTKEWPFKIDFHEIFLWLLMHYVTCIAVVVSKKTKLKKTQKEC